MKVYDLIDKLKLISDKYGNMDVYAVDVQGKEEPIVDAVLYEDSVEGCSGWDARIVLPLFLDDEGH